MKNLELDNEQEELKIAGLKVTLPRIKILATLKTLEQHHISAEDVYKRLLESGDAIGLATVYRVLTQFESVNLIKRHNFEDGHSVFELNQHKHHDHLVCIQCRCIEEFVDAIIENRQEAIAAEAGFKITDHSLTIYGICRECQKSV